MPSSKFPTLPNHLVAIVLGIVDLHRKGKLKMQTAVLETTMWIWNEWKCFGMIWSQKLTSWSLTSSCTFAARYQGQGRMLAKHKDKFRISSRDSSSSCLKYKLFLNTISWMPKCINANWTNLPHSLLNKRVSAGFTDDQISPLYNDDWNEESRMTGVL